MSALWLLVSDLIGHTKDYWDTRGTYWEGATKFTNNYVPPYCSWIVLSLALPWGNEGG